MSKTTHEAPWNQVEAKAYEEACYIVETFKGQETVLIEIIKNLILNIKPKGGS